MYAAGGSFLLCASQYRNEQDFSGKWKSVFSDIYVSSYGI